MAGRDRLSELPVDLLYKIVILLPIHEAARMAVLSTLWRDLWFGLTHLNFDSDFFGYIREKHTANRNVERRIIPSDVWISAGMYVINKVLAQHNGPIWKFVIHCPYEKKKEVRSRWYDFDQWLRFVTQRGVEEIYLKFNAKVYSVPNFLFSCLTLKRLHLCRVFVQINVPRILSNITSLSFKLVSFDSGDRQESAANLPMLENLSFTNCQDVCNFNITTPKLDSVTIKNCYGCLFNRFFPVNLDFASVRTFGLDAYNVQEFVDGCTAGRGTKLQPPVLNVEYLKILSNKEYFRCLYPEVISLLQMCPKLCVLGVDLQFIDVVLHADEEMQIFSKGVEVAVQKHNMLHTLKLTNFEASEFDLLFIKALLAGLPAVENVVISPQGTIESDEKFENIRKLLCLPRASSKAEIVFSPPIHLTLTRNGELMHCFLAC